MAENSAISWTDHSASSHRGCNWVRIVLPDGTRVASECDRCYAWQLVLTARGGKFDGRDAEHPEIWGNPKTTPRWKNKYPRQLIPHIQRMAVAQGRQLLFSNSMSDLFETHPQVGPWRDEYLGWLEAAPNVDHLLLTKRIQHVVRMVPKSWLQRWPKNVWIGYSAGTQPAMNLRAKYAEAIRAAGCPVVFVSIEPTLERVDPSIAIKYGANWLIDGGESGPLHLEGERDRVDADPDWFRHIRDVAGEHRVAYFHKQAGGRRPGTGEGLDGRRWHQWPDTSMGSVGGVRSAPGSELLAV